MRRMISQKQIEGLENLNNTFIVDNSNLNISNDIEFINIETSVPWMKFVDTDKVGHAFIGNYGDANTLYVGTVDEQVGGENITFENSAITIWTGGYEAVSVTYNESNERIDVNFPDITQITFDDATTIIIPMLPTSDPHVAGALWNDNGVLKISSGS